MENKQILESIKERVTSRGLMMSRVPYEVRENFINLACNKFEGDYGMCLLYLYEQTMEYQKMKQIIFTLEQNLREKLGTNSEKEVENK